MPNTTQRSISEDLFKTQKLDLPKPETNARVQFLNDQNLQETPKTQTYQSGIFQ